MHNIINTHAVGHLNFADDLIRSYSDSQETHLFFDKIDEFPSNKFQTNSHSPYEGVEIIEY